MNPSPRHGGRDGASANFRMRHTKIVCTIGPASADPVVLEQLVDAGMNVARLNFSHGEHEDHARVVEAIREISRRREVAIAIMGDLQGPKIRLGKLPERIVERGELLRFSCEIDEEVDGIVPLPLAGVASVLRIGSPLAINDGLVRCRVTEIDAGAGTFTAEVLDTGEISSHKGVNLPGVELDMPALTEKDRRDLAFALDHEVDYLAQSFVRGPRDVEVLRSLVASHHGEHKPQIIAKIEQHLAVERLDDILAASDGVMVARGDLGVEMGPEEVPLLQKRIISRAIEFAIPVITATQMLDSMTHRPEPTRAEASDVANAVLDGTSAVMLSGETAVGDFPIHAVRVLDRISRTVEPSLPVPELYFGRRAASIPQALSDAACEIAEMLNAAAIVVTTATGRTARQVSKNRPRRTIIAATDDVRVATRMALDWGTHPVYIANPKDTDDYWWRSVAAARDSGLVGLGERVVYTAGTILKMPGMTNMLKVEEFVEPSSELREDATAASAG